MIDIHCHLLFGVDDGPQTIEESIAMLKEAHSQGIDTMILTPHYRHGMFAYPGEEIAKNYTALKPYAEELGIALTLGTEYHINTQVVESLESGRCRTLAGSRYVLSEYSHDSEFSFVYQMTQELILHGYIPVLAHVERYACMTESLERAERIRQMGGWIQLNADAVLGLEGMGPKKFCKKMLKAGYVDVIASDSHGIDRRACHMERCQAFLQKKYGEEYTERLMQQNPAKIVAGEMH